MSEAIENMFKNKLAKRLRVLFLLSRLRPPRPTRPAHSLPPRRTSDLFRPDPKEARMAVQRWTSRRRAAFLTALSDTGNVSAAARAAGASRRSGEHTSELQSLMRTSYAVFCLQKKKIL